MQIEAVSSFKRKILDLNALADAVRRARAAGRTVVQCHGCFDIVHPGHILHLEFAARQGDVLVVTITGDGAIDKGAQRPYIPQELRAENVAALEFVDYVHIDPSPTAESVLQVVTPDVYVKGREYETSRDPHFLTERSVVESAGGRVIFSSGNVVFSSSQLIDGLSRDTQLEFERLRLVCRRHAVDREVLEHAIDSMSGLRVAVVGDVILDRYVFCEAVDVATESPTLSLVRRDERCYVGGAAIVARHAAALGAETLLLSAGFGGPAAASVGETLCGEGIHFETVGSRPSMIDKTRFVADDAKLLKVESSEAVPLDSVAEKEASVILEGWSRGLDAVIFCDFGYGAVTASLLERVLPCLRANVGVLAGDVSGSRGNLLHFRNFDLLCPTERELRNTLHDLEEGLSSEAWHLAHRTQARHLICTLGKRGLVAFDRPTQDQGSPQWAHRLQSEHLPSFADRCVDRLGCGDALLSAATLTLAAGGSLMQAAYLGNAASAVEIGRLGNHPISAANLLEWLSHRAELAAASQPADSRRGAVQSIA